MIDIVIRAIPETYSDLPDTIQKFMTTTYSAFSITVILPPREITKLKKALIEQGTKIDYINFHPSSPSMAKDVNHAIERSKYDYILLTTGGVKVERDWTDVFIRECMGSVVAGISPKLNQPSSLVYYAGVVNVFTGKAGIRGFNEPYRTGTMMSKEDCISLIDDFMFFKRSVYDRVGKFDESFNKFFYEHDWCKRVRDITGLQLCYFHTDMFVYSGKLLSYETEEWVKDREKYIDKYQLVSVPPFVVAVEEVPVEVTESTPEEIATEPETVEVDSIAVEPVSDSNEDETIKKESTTRNVKRTRKNN